jgi:hypothetical protein
MAVAIELAQLVFAGIPEYAQEMEKYTAVRSLMTYDCFFFVCCLYIFGRST